MGWLESRKPNPQRLRITIVLETLDRYNTDSVGLPGSRVGHARQALMSAVPGLSATIELLRSDVGAHLNDEKDVM